MIRRATDSDLPALIGMGEAFHSVVIDDSPFAPDDFRASLRAWMHDPEWCVLIDDERQGFLVGMLVRDYWNWKNRRATELMWWVDPDARGGVVGLALLQEFREWAERHGAQSWVLTQMTETREHGSFYKRAGLVPRETVFVGKI